MERITVPDSNEQPESAEAPRLPEGWWRIDELANMIGRHFRRHLEVIAEIDGKRHRALITGFFLEHRSVLHWITAAHCLEHVTDLLEHPRVDVLTARWVDNFPGSAGRGIPVDVRGLKTAKLRSDQLDVGVVWPSAHETSLFRANPEFHPFSEEAWARKSHAEPEGFYVLGFPDEWREDRECETDELYELSFEAKLATVPIVELLRANADTEPTGFWGRDRCIYGRVKLPGDRVRS